MYDAATMGHAGRIAELGEQYRRIEEERREARETLREAILDALRDEVRLAAIERWSGLGRTKVRVLARLPKE
jgi:hypothetical protein